MRSRPVILVLGGVALALGVALGCSSVDQLMDPEPRFETLVVAYGDPGPSPSPCDDVLPIVDGNTTDLEWSLAEPLFVRMSGAEGSGGPDFFLEVRAIWTDESKSGGDDRIYFMIRYPDDELNALPDLMTYMRPRGPDEICDDLVVIEGVAYCTSPIPGDPPGAECDSVVVYPLDNDDPRKSWTRLNQDGREDQVMLIFTATTPEAATDLRETNGDLLGVVGAETPDGYALSTGEDLDIWIWRAGRTNLHPIPQFPNWDKNRDAFTEIPEAKFSVFSFNSGFAEDLWVTGGGLISDVGTKPFIKNFNKIDFVTGEVTAPEVPLRIPKCPPPGRDPTEDEVAAENGGISKDLALWWEDAVNLDACDAFACSRIGRASRWSASLLSGEFDKVHGWGLVIPEGPIGSNQSARDVRARGTFEATQEKGFGVQSLEFMRLMDTENPDDLVIDPTGSTVEYRLVIGVLNNSGRVGSGSTEIRLRFEAPINRRGVSPRC